MSSTRQGFPKALAALAVAIGIAGGSYGIASAASGNNANSSSNAATATPPAASSQPWGGQRADDAESQVRGAALAKVPGGTIIRVETDADGHAAYEAHMTKSDGTPVTAYVDKSYNVVSVESR